MVLSRRDDQSGERALGQQELPDRARSGRLRLSPAAAIFFGGATLVSTDLFSRVSEGGPSLLPTLLALLPLQAVALVWLWSQRHALRRADPAPEDL